MDDDNLSLFSDRSDETVIRAETVIETTLLANDPGSTLDEFSRTNQNDILYLYHTYKNNWRINILAESSSRLNEYLPIPNALNLKIVKTSSVTGYNGRRPNQIEYYGGEKLLPIAAQPFRAKISPIVGPNKINVLSLLEHIKV